MKLHIQEDGFQTRHINVSQQDEIDIFIDERVNASLYLSYGGVETDIVSQITLAKGSSLTLMLKSEMLESCSLKQTIQINNDASLTLAYHDLGHSETNIDTEVTLQEAGASVHIQSACIADTKKHMQMTCSHLANHTSSDMNHYAIVKEHGDYRMEACGKIVKGAKESASHQTTRVLTMSEHQKSEVIPLLYIDENDVKASHATTLGQPDENQLYYLQTRGLNREMALGLLSVGYLMPMTTLFDDETLQQELKNEIEMKVGLHA